MAPKKQKSVSRGSTPMSMSIILKVPIQSGQDYKGEFTFPNSLYYPFTLFLPFAHLKTFRTMFISKFRGVYFWLVYHVTPHMLHMTTLRMKIMVLLWIMTLFDASQLTS